ncbi:MAG: hypothetical protein ACKODH_15610, partial [Limisphaerales bacterium]
MVPPTVGGRGAGDSRPPPRRAIPGGAVRWLTSPDLTRKTLDARLLNDPTLLAMASPRGFSGAAWL